MTDTSIIDKFLTDLALLFDLDINQINKETRFKEDLNATSLQYMGMISVISELVDQEINYAKIRKHKTIGDVIELIETMI